MSDITDQTTAINNLISVYATTRDQMADILGGPSDGGPNDDGLFPATNAAGVTNYVPSLAKIQADVNSAKATRVIYASAIATLDSDLIAGGGTNVTAQLQAVLNLATASRPLRLVMDGVALITGLNVLSNTEISGLPGSGFFLANGANRSAIRNATPTRGTRTDKNIAINGVTINGNQNNQAKTDSNGTWNVLIGMYGVDGVRVENCTFMYPRTFNVHTANCANVVGRNIRFVDQTGVNIGTDNGNRDGWHVNGPLQYFDFRWFYGTTWDDFVALNADDGAATDITTTNELGPWVGKGAVTDGYVGHMRLTEARNGIRGLSKTSLIDRILVEDFRGTCRNYAVSFDQFPLGSTSVTPGNFGSITFKDFDLQPHDQVSNEKLHISVTGKWKSARFVNFRKANVNDGDANFGYFVTDGTLDADQISWENLQVRDTGNMNMQSTALFSLHGKCRHFVVNGVDWLRDGSGFTGSVSGTTLTVSAMDKGSRDIIPGTQILRGAGASSSVGANGTTTVADNTVISTQLTNTNANGVAGREGTYTISVSQTVASGPLYSGVPAQGGLIVLTNDTVRGTACQARYDEISLTNIKMNRTRNAIYLGSGSLRKLRLFDVENDNSHPFGVLLYIDSGMTEYPALYTSQCLYSGLGFIGGPGALNATVMTADPDKVIIVTASGAITQTILKGRIGSATRQSVGKYLITFSENIASYAVFSQPSFDNGSSRIHVANPGSIDKASFIVTCTDDQGTLVDPGVLTVLVQQ